MIVLIDIGNSRIKLGWLDAASGARDSAPLALETNEALAAQMERWLRALPRPPARALGVSVASPARTQQVQALLAAQGCTVTWQTSSAQALGLTNAYVEPTQLGPDRWVAMLGLLAQLGPAACSEPLVLASFGTATTIDMIAPLAPAWRFVGGLILPGPAAMFAALARDTARLPLAAAGLNRPTGQTAVAYPDTTQDAMASGVAGAQAGALLRQWRLALQAFGQPPQVFVTGGGWPLVADEVHRALQDAARLHGLSRLAIHERPHPVLDGLAALALNP